MKFTIQRGDVKVEVEADGPDASQLLQQLLAPSENGHVNLTERSDGNSKADKVIDFFQDLGDTPWAVLMTLFEHPPEGLTDLELKKSLEAKDITSLAGLPSW